MSAPGTPPAENMVWVPGGTFLMGSDRHYPEEAPAHPVSVDGFWMDRAPVTNRQFRRFVEDTGYTTSAEIAPDPAQYPGALPEMLPPASVVFVRTTGPVDLLNHFAWWRFIPGADWRHPRGPGSSIEGLDDHPVLHVAFSDVEAYVVGFGITLNRFSIYLLQNRNLSPDTTHLLLRNTENAGAGMVVLGLAVMIWSVHRFWRVSQDIERAQYVPRHGAVLLLTLGLIALGGVTALWLFGL
jgi:uncharacterized membrane protein YidH (DUF202 family)